MHYLKSLSSTRYIIAGVLLVLVGVGIGALTTRANPQARKTTAATTNPASATAAMTNLTCSKTDAVAIANKTYMAQNNLWNGAATGQQCIKIDTTSGAFTVSQADNKLPTNGAPASYASIYKGCHWGSCTTDSHLPIQVSNIASVKSQWNIKTVPGAWDSSYDIWFNSTPTANGQPDGAELMIWINHSGAPQPFGSQTGAASIEGAKWNVWSAYQGWNTISYVDTTPTQSVDFDIKHFIADAVARGQIKSNWYLTAVEAGFELWQGGAGMTSNAFSVSPVAAK